MPVFAPKQKAIWLCAAQTKTNCQRLVKISSLKEKFTTKANAASCDAAFCYAFYNYTKHRYSAATP